MHPSMIVHWLCVLLASGALLAPSWAVAQCAFNQPTGSSTYTGYFATSLVRAFVSCNNPGGNAPNATNAAGNVPTCAPVENFNQKQGSPAGGWEFRPGSSYGRLTIKRTSGGANLTGFPPTLRDAAVTLKLYHIGQTGSGGFADGDGVVVIILRATMDDYSYGDMTAIDFPLQIPVHVSNGSVSKTMKIGDRLKELHVPRFPDCTTLEVVSAWVSDPNGSVFAVSGVKFP